MNGAALFAAVCIAAILLAQLYRRWALNTAMKRLYELKANADGKEYIEALDSRYAQFNFSPFTRNMMKLNYWIEQDREDEVRKLLSALDQTSTNDKEKATFLSRLFGYYVSRGDMEKAAKYRDILQNLLAGKKDDFSAGILYEADQVDAVFIRKDPAYIPAIESMITEVTNPSQKAMYMYRLAKLYYADGNTSKAMQILEEALEVTEDEAERKKLEILLRHPEQLG